LVVWAVACSASWLLLGSISVVDLVSGLSVAAVSAYLLHLWIGHGRQAA
jgi:multisubunit Na+/H+ antiporter MnhE subunit